MPASRFHQAWARLHEVHKLLGRGPTPPTSGVLFRVESTLIGAKSWMVSASQTGQINSVPSWELDFIRGNDRKDLCQKRVRLRAGQSPGHERLVDPRALSPARRNRGNLGTQSPEVIGRSLMNVPSRLHWSVEMGQRVVWIGGSGNYLSPSHIQVVLDGQDLRLHMEVG